MFTSFACLLRLSRHTSRRVMSNPPTHQDGSAMRGQEKRRREDWRQPSPFLAQCFLIPPQYFCMDPRQLHGAHNYLSQSAPGGYGPGPSQQRQLCSGRSSSTNPPRKNKIPTERIGMGERFWQKASDTSKSGKGINFKLLSFNVLAQDLLVKHPELYVRNKPHCLEWGFRWQRILAEIKRHNCDILCLQEVQQSHLRQFYRKELKQMGYHTGLFKQRTNGCPDGCAIFFKTNALQLVECEMVEFNRPGVSILNRDNVGIIARFAPVLSPKDQFVVCTTHLLYNPRREDVRIAQIQLFLSEIERIAFDKTQKSGYLPVILTGDFNSTPDSCLLTLLRKSVLDFGMFSRKTEWIPPGLGITDNCQHLGLMKARHSSDVSREEQTKLILPSAKKRGTSEDDPSDKDYFKTGRLSHNFCFSSVYKQEVSDGKSCESTTFQNKWISVDYILYSGKRAGEFGGKPEDRLVLLERYTLPVRRDLKSVAIPNDSLGSDHLSLLAQFRLIFSQTHKPH